MTKDELLTLLMNAKTVVIRVVGKLLTIYNWNNGTYSIGDQDNIDTFNSAFDLIEKYTVMNMRLEEITPWIQVATVG